MRPVFFALMITGLVFSSKISAQLRWKDISDSFSGLPSGIRVFESRDSMEGKPNRCFYISADLKDKHLEFTTQSSSRKRLTPQQFFEQEGKPVVVVNGTFFSFQTNSNLNSLIREGKQLGYNVPTVKNRNDSLYRYVTRSVFGISKNRKPDVAWLFTDTATKYPLALQKAPLVKTGPHADPDMSEIIAATTKENGVKKKWKMQTAIGGGPALLHNGEIRITNKEEIMFVNGEADRHPRTAMGYTADRRLIILMVEGRNPGIAEGMTLKQEAMVLKSLGCIEGLNLDGGGSSCLLLNGKETIKPSDKEGQRPVPGVFMIYHVR
ncbi:MAG: phosphodiester glycosidase family protein [Chitinophagaceae bacterium]|nr:phosphodiester glycosidase family protein [Chitinophagaceae bacterium]